MKQKLLKTLVLLCALIVGSATSWAETYTWTTANGQLTTTTTSFTVNTVTWSFTPTWADSNKKYVSWVGGSSLYYQIGSAKNIMSSLEISTSSIAGTITNVQVVWSSAAANSSSLAVSVGSTNFTSTNSSSSSSTLQTSSFEGSASGTLNLTFTCTTGIKIQQVVVTYAAATIGVTGVSLKPTELNLTVGSDATLTATVAPANASNKNVTWNSDNTSVATVDEYGVVTAQAVGTATITVTTDEGDFSASCNVTVREAKDYATLPFNWEGGVSSDFTSLEGVTASGLGSDYAAGNAPYRVKFDSTGDYIQIKTDSQIGNISVDVKMIGGDVASSITVKESTDGTEFTDVQTLSISGDQNDILSLKTTNAFASTSRYIRLVFTKGSNVGVGPISIEKGITISSVGYATLYTPAALDFSSVDGLTAYTAVKDGDVVRLTSVSNVQANTGVVLEGAAGTTYSIPAIESSTTDRGQLTGNATAATAWDAESGYTYYVLASTGSGVEFSPVNAGEIAAGKAFLKVAGGSPVHAFNVVFGDETGISETMRNGDDEKMSAIFDLSGRRVAKPVKGLYIVNGKKIMVK